MADWRRVFCSPGGPRQSQKKEKLRIYMKNRLMSLQSLILIDLKLKQNNKTIKNKSSKIPYIFPLINHTFSTVQPKFGSLFFGLFNKLCRAGIECKGKRKNLGLQTPVSRLPPLPSENPGSRLQVSCACHVINASQMNEQANHRSKSTGTSTSRSSSKAKSKQIDK